MTSHDKGAKMLGFTDNYGENGNVGDVVGFDENFANMGYPMDKLFKITECPNGGDMVVMSEISDYSYDETTKTYTCVDVVKGEIFTVEPYKVILI